MEKVQGTAKEKRGIGRLRSFSLIFRSIQYLMSYSAKILEGEDRFQEEDVRKIWLFAFFLLIKLGFSIDCLLQVVVLSVSNFLFLL